MSDQAQIIDPQQGMTIESIISQEAPGKGGEQEAAALGQTLEGMSNDDLMSLVEQAYKEDPEANSLVVQKATALLEQRGQGDQVKEKMRSMRSESWRSLLGEWLGGELYDAISDQANEAALLEHGKSALKGAADGAVDALGGIGLDQGSTQALQTFAKALTETAVAEGEKFLESEAGQRLLGKISRWVDDHPGYVVAMAVLAAAGAVAADVDLPELEQKFKFGKGFSGDVSANLGSIRNIALKSAKLNLQYVRGQLKINAGVAHDQEKGTSGELGVRYGDKENFVQTKGTIDADGNLVVGLDAAMKAGLFTGSISGEQNFGTDVSTGDVKLRYGTEEQFISSGLTLGSDGNLTTNIGAGFSQGLFSSSLNGSFDHSTDALTASSNLRYGTDENFLNLDTGFSNDELTGSLTGRKTLGENRFMDGRLSYADGAFSSEMGTTNLFDGGQVRSYMGAGDQVYSGFDMGYKTPGVDLSFGARDVGMDGTFDRINMDLGLSPSDMAQITLKYAQEVGGATTGSANLSLGTEALGGSLDYSYDGTDSRIGGEAHFKRGDWHGNAEFTHNLDRGEMEKLGFELGFRDPDEFRAFSVEFSRNVKEGVASHELGGMFETELGDFMLRGQGQATWTQDDVKANAGLLGAYRINDNWAAIAGGQANYDSNTGTSFMPQGGVQYKDVPLTMGYDLETKAVTFGISIPFGR